ncbi:radical SAM protein [Citrobacter amalonaticus]|uniref:radical SAM protein n=1 Tax=Citrobacter amalonaticus TaxID=35703 RepID=UPI00300D2BCA
MARTALSHCALDCCYCFYNDTSSGSVLVDRQNSQQPEQVYQQLRQSGASLQFIPLVEWDACGMLTAESVEPQAWGTFLTAIFDIWVREDIGRVSIRLFDVMLDLWCGHSHSAEKPTPGEACRNCSVFRFCRGDCPKHRDDSGKSELCAGYHAFINHSAPYMRVMRDLIRQHRSPAELMAMLR